MNTIKTAISMPQEDFKMVEAIRKRTGKSRSQILLESFHVWLKTQTREELEKTYQKAYHDIPETIAEVKAMTKAGAGVWHKENW